MPLLQNWRLLCSFQQLSLLKSFGLFHALFLDNTQTGVKRDVQRLKVAHQMDFPLVEDMVAAPFKTEFHVDQDLRVAQVVHLAH